MEKKEINSIKEVERIVGEEPANMSSKRKSFLSKAAIISLALLVAKGAQYYNRELRSQAPTTEEIVMYDEKTDYVSLDIGYYTVDLCKPEEFEIDGVKVYGAPSGFTKDGDVCMRISTKMRAPEGYQLGTYGTAYNLSDGVTISVPEGYKLIGDRGIKVILVEPEEINGEMVKNVPSGYNVVDNYAYRIVDATIKRTQEQENTKLR